MSKLWKGAFPTPFSPSSSRSREKTGFHFLIGQSRYEARMYRSTAWKADPNTLLRVHFNKYSLNSLCLVPCRALELMCHRTDEERFSRDAQTQFCLRMGMPEGKLSERQRLHSAKGNATEWRWTTRKAVWQWAGGSSVGISLQISNR